MTQPSPYTNALQHTMPLPRNNGELMFHSPWESRVFAMAVLLCEKGAYAWTTCNAHFATCIGEADMHHPEKERFLHTTTTGGKHWNRCFWRKKYLWRSSYKRGRTNLRPASAITLVKETHIIFLPVSEKIGSESKHSAPSSKVMGR